VIAIDPGVMTGYCQGMITTGKLHYMVFQQTDEVDDLWRRLKDLEPRFIVIESFEFRGGHQRAATGINYFPLQLIGVARLYAEVATHQCACYLQTPAQGKGYYTNSILKQQGVLKRGMATGVPHGVDALRHMLQWYTFGPGFKYNTNGFVAPYDTWSEVESAV
jgi:hypothetical protein